MMHWPDHKVAARFYICFIIKQRKEERKKGRKKEGRKLPADIHFASRIFLQSS